jgi:hypothetical protein
VRSYDPHPTAVGSASVAIDTPSEVELFEGSSMVCGVPFDLGLLQPKQNSRRQEYGPAAYWARLLRHWRHKTKASNRPTKPGPKPGGLSIREAAERIAPALGIDLDTAKRSIQRWMFEGKLPRPETQARLNVAVGLPAWFDPRRPSTAAELVTHYMAVKREAWQWSRKIGPAGSYRRTDVLLPQILWDLMQLLQQAQSVGRARDQVQPAAQAILALLSTLKPTHASACHPATRGWLGWRRYGNGDLYLTTPEELPLAAYLNSPSPMPDFGPTHSDWLPLFGLAAALALHIFNVTRAEIFTGSEIAINPIATWVLVQLVARDHDEFYRLCNAQSFADFSAIKNRLPREFSFDNKIIAHTMQGLAFGDYSRQVAMWLHAEP